MAGKVFNFAKGVLSFNGRKGNVVSKDGDYTADQVGAANKELSNLTDYQKALHNIGAKPNRNWLPNSYLIGGGTPGKLPINQTGALIGSTDWEYMFDCWKQFGGEWSLTANGLSMSPRDGAAYWSVLNYSYVDVNQLIGKQFTLSFYVDDEIYSDTQTLEAGTTAFNGFPGADRCEVILDQSQSTLVAQYYGSNVDSRVIHAAKLEEGDHQTLGWKGNDGTVHLFDTTKYEEELEKCLYYQYVMLPLNGGSSVYGHFALLKATSSNILDGLIYIPFIMRSTPVASILNKQSLKVIKIGTQDWSSAYVSAISVYSAVGNALKISVELSDNVLEIGSLYELRTYGDGHCGIIFNSSL